MDLKGLITQCKVRQCSECQNKTEHYCNTCKHDLCLQCKERHFIDLDTTYHNVVVYREKYKFVLKQEICERHPGRIYEMFCNSCQLPVCDHCTEHKESKLFAACYQSTEQKEHKIHDIRKAYYTNRQQNRQIISRIRGEDLYTSCLILSEIRYDIKFCHKEIFNYRKEIAGKAKRLKDLINTVICEIKIRHKRKILKLKQQDRKMNKHLVKIENYEQRSEESANRPIQFLSFQKKPFISRKSNTSNLLKHTLLSLSKKFNREDVIKLLTEIQVTEQTGSGSVIGRAISSCRTKKVTNYII
ncbi:probable RING finger protein 207 homolog [Saccostrea cucullata]|uniref:probable RING finger protein 207 homolog n=1 Tax=Saccostrea cuccullata TaxID=36930 RepID=UPI002ED363E9